MKQFFKIMFASAFGVLISVGIFFFLGFSFLFGLAASSSSESEYKPKENTVFKLRLEGALSDQVQENPFASLLGEEETKMALPDVVKAIRKAKANPNISGIYIEANSMAGGFASYEAIRRELIDFKKSGKFIVSYSDMYSQGNYYLASVADSLFVNPQGGVNLVGLASQGIFIKGLAAKLGIEYYIFKVGTYKSAVEPLMLDKFSDANREQLTSFLGSIWGNMTKEICESRGIKSSDLECFLNEGLALGDEQEMLNYKLVDGFRYRVEAEACVKRMAGQDMEKEMITADVKKMLAVKESTLDTENRIAILYAEGSIQESAGSVVSSEESVITEKTADELRKLAKDETVKAVVFRVNSPGGSAYISEQIWKAVVDLKAQKPIVVSMGDYAASGGYYISCAANKIVTEHTTLTGSIGIFGIVPNLSGTAKLLDVTTDMVKTNTYADLGDMTRPMREDEKLLIQRSVERGYDLFLTRCADGRGMSKEAIDQIGQGRVWTGDQALERGLVDRIGGLDVAVAEAASLAGVSEYQIYKANKDTDFFTEYLTKMASEVRFAAWRSVLGDEYKYLSILRQMKQSTGLQARMPFLLQGFGD